MKVFAISDPHFSSVKPKPMDKFGDNWANHMQKMQEAWCAKVTEEDVVLIPGDISWAMHMADAKPDLDFLGNCPGKEVILRGNHDYWWSSISKVRSILPKDMYAIQNDSLRIGSLLLAGTRGWVCPNSTYFNEAEDQKIYDREVARLALSFQAAKREPNDFFVVMMHYPPFNERQQENGFLQLIDQYQPDCVIYGHLHGKSCKNAFEGERNGVQYRLTSCDYLNFEPLLLEVLASSAEKVVQ